MALLSFAIRLSVVKGTHETWLGYIFWILGFTGLHRFYFGKKISGAIWFVTLGVCGIGWLVDLFLIPRMRREADARYRQGGKDFTLGWLLQAFLGVFGLHRFYLGKWVTGLVWLLTGGLLGVGWIYDFFTLNEQLEAA
jgi:TM2 domain-containing membrane protein YozV